MTRIHCDICDAIVEEKPRVETYVKPFGIKRTLDSYLEFRVMTKLSDYDGTYSCLTLCWECENKLAQTFINLNKPKV